MSELIGQRYTRNMQNGDFLKAQWKNGLCPNIFFHFPHLSPWHYFEKMPKVDIEIWVLSAFKRLCYVLGEEEKYCCWSLELCFHRKD